MLQKSMSVWDIVMLREFCLVAELMLSEEKCSKVLLCCAYCVLLYVLCVLLC